MKKSTRRNLVIVAIVLVAVVSGVLFMGARNKGPKTLEAPFTAAAMGPLEERVSASGSFQAERYSVVASQTYGIVQKVYVKPGDHVEKGDLIVVVDEREARESYSSAQIALEDTRRNIAVQLSSLRAEIRTATLSLEQAKRALKNAESLKAVDGISEEEYRKANESRAQAEATLADAYDRLRVAQGAPEGTTPSLDARGDAAIIESSPSYERAKLSLVSAKRVLDGCVMRAEISGTVTELGVAQGDRLKAETVVARIEDPSSVKAEVNVDEVDVGKIREGMKAEITADSMLGKKIDGTVIRIWPVVKTNGNGRVCLVRIAIADGGNRILSGASCMARITSTLRDRALTIPASALLPGAKPAAVWVAVEQTDDAKAKKSAGISAGDVAAAPADQEKTSDAEASTAPQDTSKSPGKAVAGKAPAPKKYKAVRRDVTIGASTVSTVEITSGLKEGELVIVDRLPAITEGAIVVDSNGGNFAGGPGGKI
jgi:HlyD family secretion protein